MIIGNIQSAVYFLGFLLFFVMCPYICVLFVLFPVKDIQIHIDILVLPLY